MGGNFNNNIGGPVKNKVKFLSSYKFSIAMENTEGQGYISEKILDSFLYRIKNCSNRNKIRNQIRILSVSKLNKENKGIIILRFWIILCYYGCVKSFV